MLEAVFFDFDGVIFDTPTYYFKHMKAYLHEHNASITDEDIAHLVGMTFGKKFEYINQKYGLKLERDHFVNTTSEAMMNDIGNNFVLDVSLRKLLNELKKAKIPIAIASNNSKSNIDYFLNGLGISVYFSKITAYHDLKEFKPH